MAKRSYPLSKVYGLLEPGPVLLLTTAHKGSTNVMTMSWHTMMEFVPPLVGCGNTSGRRVDKFKAFGLTRPARRRARSITGDGTFSWWPARPSSCPRR